MFYFILGVIVAFVIYMITPKTFEKTNKWLKENVPVYWNSFINWIKKFKK